MSHYEFEFTKCASKIFNTTPSSKKPGMKHRQFSLREFNFSFQKIHIINSYTD